MNEPKRLRDGALGDDLGMLVRAAEADVLDEKAVARMRARLAAVGVASASVMVAKPAAFHALALKLVGLVASAGVIAAIAIAAWPAHHPAAVATSLATTTTIASPPVAPSVIETAAPRDVPSISVTDLPRARRVSRAPEPVTAAPAATTPREGLLLLRARRALPTDPALALTLVRQHETEFPDSQLAPERDKIRGEAEQKVTH